MIKKKKNNVKKALGRRRRPVKRWTSLFAVVTFRRSVMTRTLSGWIAHQNIGQRVTFTSTSCGQKMGKRIRKFRTTVYPSKSAPIATKLCENAFQTIPNILFFYVNKHFVRKVLVRSTCFSRFVQCFEKLRKIWRHHQIPRKLLL